MLVAPINRSACGGDCEGRLDWPPSDGTFETGARLGSIYILKLR